MLLEINSITTGYRGNSLLKFFKINISVQNCKVSIYSPYLKAVKLAGHAFRDAGRRHEKPGTETKNFLSHVTTSSLSFVFLWFPLFLCAIAVTHMGLGGYFTWSRFVSQLKNLKIRKPEYFIMDYKPAWTWPRWCLGGEIFFLW